MLNPNNLKVKFCVGLFLCLYYSGVCQNDPNILKDQLVELNLNFTSEKNNFTINSSTVIYTDNAYSSIYESDFSTADESKVRLHRILADENVEFEFKLEPKSDTDLKIGIVEYDLLNNTEYVFHFSGTTPKVKVTAPGYESNEMFYNSETIFRVIKCQSGIYFFKDQYTVNFVPSNDERHEATMICDQADNIDALLHLKWLSECDVIEVYPKYAVLNTEANVPETLLDDRVLRFYYLEKYAIVDGVNDQIAITIFDAEHVVVGSELLLLNKTGSNFQEIDLDAYGFPSSLEDHLVMVKGANKEIVYYLRISEN